MLYNSDFIKKTFIVKNIARTAGLAGQVAVPSLLAEGEVVITNNSNVILDTTTILSAKDIKLVQGRGADKDLLQTKLGIKELTQYVGTPYTADQEEIAYIGFNGTSGSISAANNYSYVPFVAIRPNTMFLGQQNLLFWYGPYTSTSSASQVSVATGIMKSFVANFNPMYEVEKFIKVELVSDGTFTSSATTAVVTKGSRTVTFGSNVTVASGAYLRIGGSGATNPVYLVETGVTSGTTVTLDVPYKGASATIASGSIGVMSSVSNWGVKLSGQPENFDIYSIRQYDKISFELGGTLNDSTTTIAQPSKVGFGNPSLVTIDENASWGFEGQQYILGIPPKFRFTDVVSTGTYSALSFGFKKSTNHTNGIGSVRGQVIVYADKNGGFNTNATGASTSVIDVLDTWMINNGWDSQAGNL